MKKAITKTFVKRGWRLHDESLNEIVNLIKEDSVDCLFKTRREAIYVTEPTLGQRPIKTRITVTVTVEDL